MQETQPEELLPPAPTPELIEAPVAPEEALPPQAPGLIEVPHDVTDTIEQHKAEQAAASAALPNIAPVAPMPGTDPEKWTTPPEGSSGVMKEAGGYTNLDKPTEAQRLENERLMTEAAGQPSEAPQAPEVPEVQ